MPGGSHQRVVRIADRRITIQIADEGFSPVKTGLTDDQLIEVELADICGSEFSPFQIEREARGIQNEIEREYWLRARKMKYSAFLLSTPMTNCLRPTQSAAIPATR